MKTKRIKPAKAVGHHVKRMEVHFEEAMDIAGAGKYQVFHCSLMLAALSSALLEIIGYSFILPAAACDLNLSESIRGLIISIPNIGIILTAPFWGRAADHYGRKPVLLICTAGCGVCGLVAALMPDLISFGLCKLAGALFISSPSSLSFAYAGEMAPRRRRDLAVLVCNGLLTFSSVLNPLLAWAVLSADWQFNLGSLNMRPWRLLTIVNALPLLFVSMWMTQAKESPKFLMAKGKRDEALEVLRHIYATNTGQPVDSFDVISLKKSTGDLMGELDDDEDSELTPKTRRESALALLKPPHLKRFALTSFLMFGLCTSLNGLFLFATDTINKVLRESPEESGTLCMLMNQPNNETISEDCMDTISQDTFVIMVGTTAVYGAVVLGASVLPVRKMALLVGMFLATAGACLLAGLLTNIIVAGIAFSALQVTALGIGPLTAYAVQLFPTSLRGTAVSAVLMWGRVGSVVGANIAGILLATACTATFYGFGSLLLVCAALSFLLPKERREHEHIPETANDNR